MRNKKILAMICAAFLLTACSDGGEQSVNPVEGQESTNKKEFTTPFSGEAVAKQPKQRPVIATINNHPDARPQSGIGSADIVFEMLAEGDVTRLLALYQSDIPTKIGPIRSARSYFVDLAKGYDAFYIAHGYSPEAKAMLERGVVDNINGMNYDGTLFKRSSDRVAPHNSYFPSENLKEASEKVDASLLYQKKVLYSFYEPDTAVSEGMAANDIQVTYSGNASFNSAYHYDADTQAYTRSSANVQTVDYLTNEAVSLSNVLFFEMEHQVIDNEGRKDINITSGGKAYVAQQGVLREVRWENKDGLLVALEADGTKVKLVPGQTWIHFMPTSPGLEQSVTYSE